MSVLSKMTMRRWYSLVPTATMAQTAEETRDASHLKRVVDDEAVEVMKRLGFVELHYLPRAKLSLGALASVAGCAAYAVPGKLEDVYWLALSLVVAFCVLHGSMQLLTALKEGDTTVRAGLPHAHQHGESLRKHQWSRLAPLALATKVQHSKASVVLRVESVNNAEALEEVNVADLVHSDGGVCAPSEEAALTRLLDRLSERGAKEKENGADQRSKKSR